MYGVVWEGEAARPTPIPIARTIESIEVEIAGKARLWVESFHDPVRHSRSFLDVIRLDFHAHHYVRGNWVHVRREKLFHLMRRVELAHRTIRLGNDRGLFDFCYSFPSAAIS
jgi:hypothetical protein